MYVIGSVRISLNLFRTTPEMLTLPTEPSDFRFSIIDSISVQSVFSKAYDFGCDLREGFMFCITEEFGILSEYYLPTLTKNKLTLLIAVTGSDAISSTAFDLFLLVLVAAEIAHHYIF